MKRGWGVHGVLTVFSLFSFQLSVVNTYCLFNSVLNKIISNMNSVVRKNTN